MDDFFSGRYDDPQDFSPGKFLLLGNGLVVPGYQSQANPSLYCCPGMLREQLSQQLVCPRRGGARGDGYKKW